MNNDDYLKKLENEINENYFVNTKGKEYVERTMEQLKNYIKSKCVLCFSIYELSEEDFKFIKTFDNDKEIDLINLMMYYTVSKMPLNWFSDKHKKNKSILQSIDKYSTDFIIDNIMSRLKDWYDEIEDKYKE